MNYKGFRIIGIVQGGSSAWELDANGRPSEHLHDYDGDSHASLFEIWDKQGYDMADMFEGDNFATIEDAKKAIDNV